MGVAFWALLVILGVLFTLGGSTVKLAVALSAILLVGVMLWHSLRYSAASLRTLRLLDEGRVEDFLIQIDADIAATGPGRVRTVSLLNKATGLYRLGRFTDALDALSQVDSRSVRGRMEMVLACNRLTLLSHVDAAQATAFSVAQEELFGSQTRDPALRYFKERTQMIYRLLVERDVRASSFFTVSDDPDVPTLSRAGNLYYQAVAAQISGDLRRARELYKGAGDADVCYRSWPEPSVS